MASLYRIRPSLADPLPNRNNAKGVVSAKLRVKRAKPGLPWYVGSSSDPTPTVLFLRNVWGRLVYDAQFTRAGDSNFAEKQLVSG